MNFPKHVQEAPITPPIILHEIDDALGAKTQDAFKAAILRSPRLGGLVIIASDQKSNFIRSPLGLGGSQVNMRPDPEYYKEFINNGLVAQRMIRFSELYRSKGITPRVNELIVAVLLHEIGHAEDYANYISNASGNVKAAFELSNKVRATELATLPLKAATANAMRAWDDNTNGYRDAMQAQGITGTRWQELLDQNANAYTDLPCEKVADRFALGVLASISA